MLQRTRFQKMKNLKPGKFDKDQSEKNEYIIR